MFILLREEWNCSTQVIFICITLSGIYIAEGNTLSKTLVGYLFRKLDLQVFEVGRIFDN